MKIAYFALTDEGINTAMRVRDKIGGTLEPKEGFKEAVYENFHKCDALVFVMATGIVVRTVAPLLVGKSTDPAVIVIDQKGNFVISLLSGHLGGANRLAKHIAAEIGAIPVITTATDVQGVISFDEFAKDNGLVIENLSELKYISSAILKGERVGLVSDCPVNIPEVPPEVTVTDAPTGKIRVIVSDRTSKKYQDGSEHALLLRPKSIVIGIGCKKMVPFEHLENCYLSFLDEYEISKSSVFKIATISIKAKEEAILKLCDKYGLDLEIVSDDDISNCDHEFEESSFVKSVTGVPSVAQACSYIASGCGEELTGKIKFSGVTMAACRKKHNQLTFSPE